MAEASEVPAKKDYPGVDETGIGLRPRNFEELWKFAQMVCETEFVPGAFRSKPGAVIAACQLGNEVGLPPMTALKWIAVINGTPSIWGDGYWMLVSSHPRFEWARELGPDEALEKGYGECTIKRKDRAEPITRRYTKEMAERAGLWGGKGATEEKRKYSPWFTNPGRMLQMRARALAGRDGLPEATGPLSMREEAEDFEPRDVTPVEPKPEPLRIPEPTKEKPNAAPAADAKPREPEGAPEDNQRSSDQAVSSAPAEVSSADVGSNEGRTTQKTKLEGTPEQKLEAALKEIAGYTEQTFPNAAHLNVYLKGLPQNMQFRITTAFNERKKELGL